MKASPLITTQRTNQEMMADLNQALKLLGNAATKIALCSGRFIVLTSSSSTAGMEARIQTGALPAVGWSALFAFLDSVDVYPGGNGSSACSIRPMLPLIAAPDP
jgi:uncharacterized protein (DUF1697 family)